MEIIPAIDIIGGKCVRLEQGDFYRATTYDEDPLELAMQFEDAGLKRLHLVDLDGARLGQVRNWRVLERIAGKTGLSVDFGGGIRTEKDVRIVLDSGGTKVTVGSMAVKDETEFIRWLKVFGVTSFFLGADVKNENIAIEGWQQLTGVSIFDFIKKFTAHGISEIFCTDVARDGKLEGPSLELYGKILESFPALELVASGGISSVDDIESLQSAGCHAAIIGKALYEKRITLQQLKWIKG